MPKCVLALALGRRRVLVGNLVSVMGLTGSVRTIAVMLCIVGGIMLMIQSTKNEEASAKQGDGSGH